MKKIFASAHEADKPKSKKQMSKKTKTILSIVLGFIAVCFMTGVVVFGYVFVSIISVANGEIVVDLREYQNNQNQTSIIYAYDSNGKLYELQRLHGTENRIWVNLASMPKSIQNAFIALEDKRFEKHHGVDWFRTASVIVKYRFSQGGSTITQQLIKNLTNEKDTTFVRKFNEISYALNMENNFSKNDIMEGYLNTLYLGEGCYGVKTACEKYFGKDISEINIAEAACIASITQKPYAYDPLINPEENRVRQLKCLEFMLDQNKITKEEYDAAVAYKMVFTNSPDYVAPEKEEDTKEEEKTEKYQSFYVDYIINTLIKQFKQEYKMSEDSATHKIYYGGLKIYAAIDESVQNAVENVYVNRKTFPNESSAKKKVQSAMTVMDYSGRIVAICGEAGAKSGNRCLNRAADSPRQPGSTIKPLSAYSPAIDKNIITWSTLVQDKAIAYQGKIWPKNYTGDYGTGAYITVQNALARSVNTVVGRIVVNMLGTQTSLDYLSNVYHISTVDPVEDNLPSPLATGGMYNGVTTLEMAAAYAVFGNGGKYYEPFAYYKVTNFDGSTVYFDNTNVKGEQVIAEDTAGVMCELLQSVTTSSYGTGTRYKIDKFQTMAKTGTTTDDNDRWFIAGTPYYISAVWYGYDYPKTISNVSGNPCGKIFKEVMSKVHKDLPAKQFAKSKLVVEKKYCLQTGLLAGPNCTSTAVGWYKITNLPATCSNCTAQQPTAASGENLSDVAQSAEDFFNDILGRFN